MLQYQLHKLPTKRKQVVWNVSYGAVICGILRKGKKTLHLFSLCRENLSSLNLAVIQVAKPSNDLLLVQLICLQLHAPHRLHDAVILQTLITSHDHLSGRGLIQLVDITFLKGGKKKKTKDSQHKPRWGLVCLVQNTTWCLKLTFISKVAWVVKSAYVRADMTAAAPWHGREDYFKMTD